MNNFITKFAPHLSKDLYELDKQELLECAEHYLNEAIDCSDSEMIVEYLCKTRFLYSWHSLAFSSFSDYTFDVLFCIIGHPSLDGDEKDYSPEGLAKIMKYDYALRAYVNSIAMDIDDMCGAKLTEKKKSFLKKAIKVYSKIKF